MLESPLQRLRPRANHARSWSAALPCLMLAGLALAAGPAPAATVFVNEIHYDNAGTDAGEAIEVAGPAGTDLAGWSLVLYNGSGGAAYNTTALAGVIPNQQSGFGTLAFTYPSNGIQNGSPDGIALVDATATVVQFLSYEGTFTAVGGPASGMLSVDVGVQEPGTGPLGESLRLVGSGSVSEDFTWAASAPASFGAVNAGQTFVGGPPADPVINEFVANHVGTDTHELVEVFGDAFADYSAFRVLQIEGDGAGQGTIDSVFAVGTTNAGGFWTTAFLGNALENGSITLLLVEDFTGAIGNDVDANNDGLLDTSFWSAIVDSVAVSDGGAGDGLYSPAVLAPGFDGNAQIPGGASRIPDGADGDTAADWLRNDFDGQGLPGFTGTPSFGEAFNTPNATNQEVPPPPPALVINEIDYDQASTDTAEFIELKNVSATPADLDPYEIRLVNGTGGAVYRTIDLPAFVLAPGDYFVVCGNAANVANCDLVASPASDLIQNGAPDAVGLALSGTVVDAVSYEGDTVAPYTEGSGAGLEDDAAVAFRGISRFPDGADTGANNLDLSARCITPGGPNTNFTTGCTATGRVFEIWEIQGAGTASIIAGGVVTTEDNVVTALAADGFFLQTPDSRSDGVVDTSDGIFVFTGAAPGVAVGDQVDVTGTVVEFFGFTELGGGPIVSVDSSGNSLPAAVVFDATVPTTNPAAPTCAIEFECWEGMRISVTGGSVGGPNQRFGTDPIAEVHVVAGPARPFREKGVLFPGLPGLPIWDGNPEVFELDPDRLGLPNQIIPAGSSFDAEGVLGFEFNGWEIWPTSLAVTPVSLPRPAAAREAGEMAIGSLNMFRYFDDVDDPPSTNFLGGVRDDTGGVVSAAEFARRRAKFVAYVLGVLDAPDVLAVQEVEKLENLEALAADLQAADPSVVYDAYLFEGNDVGTIDVGFLVRDTMAVDTITQLGLTETFVNPLNNQIEVLHDRPPVLLEGRYVAGGADFAIALMVVHNRSLGGIEDPVDGPRVRQKRLEQAQSIAQKVQDLQTAEPGIRLVVLGDFNAFEITDGFVDAVGQIAGAFDPAENQLFGPDLVSPDLTVHTFGVPAEDRYSFVFIGSAQAIDHALTSSALTPLVTGFAYARGNADAAVDLINDAATPLRSSDHDGFVLHVFADSDGDGVADQGDLCAGTVVPESVPTQRLNPNHYALVDGDRVFDTVRPPGGGAGDVFTLGDTAGCSCEQIIAALDLGNGHRKHGCSVGVMRTWVAAATP